MSYTQIKNYQPYLYIGKYKLKPKCKLSIGSGIKLERQKKKKQTQNIKIQTMERIVAYLCEMNK